MNVTIGILIGVVVIQLVMVGLIILLGQQSAMINYKVNQLLSNDEVKKKRTPKPKAMGFKIAQPKATKK